MTQFVLEMYASRDEAPDLDERIERLRRAAEESSGAGAPVRCMRRMFMPADETCLLLCEAGSADAVRAVAERAEVPFERIVEAVAEPNPQTSSPEGE